MSFSGVFYIHLIAIICADILLLLAGVAAYCYLLKHKELKKKEFPPLINGDQGGFKGLKQTKRKSTLIPLFQRGKFFGMTKRLPSLKRLDQFNAIFINAGFLLFTVGLVFGCFLAAKTWGPHWYLDPKMVWSFSAFFIFFFLSVSRIATGFRGRTAALLTITGTAIVFGGLLFLPFCPQTKHIYTLLSFTSMVV